MSRKRIIKGLKWMFFIGAFGAFFCVFLLWYCNNTIIRYSENNTFNELSGLDKTDVGLVLGASPTLSNGRPNYYFVNRVKAAAKLYKSGKVKYLIVSGDNGRKEYDEPTEMKKALIKLGVPSNRIYMDYAGFRTWDSIIRCREIFSQSKFIVISQKFHNERALYIASKNDIEIQGYNASDAVSRVTSIRERLARVKVFLDVLINKKPKFLGEKIEIGKPQLDINE